MKELNIEQIIKLGLEITDRYKQILECVPESMNNLLKPFAESCLLFTSFIAYAHDESIKIKEKNK